MSATSSPVADTALQKTAYLTLSLIHAAGTYTFGTVSVGDVLIVGVDFITTVNAGGFVTMTVQVDDGPATPLLASIAVASVVTTTALTSLLTAACIVRSGRHLQATLVGGAGTVGTVLVAVRYTSLQVGALVS